LFLPHCKLNGAAGQADIPSFAKNASADMSLRGNAFITVMQTAELRDLDDPSDTRDLQWKWTLLVEAQMGPRSVNQPANLDSGYWSAAAVAVNPGPACPELAEALPPPADDRIGLYVAQPSAPAVPDN